MKLGSVEFLKTLHRQKAMHFFAIGALLFGFSTLITGKNDAESTQYKIFISEARVAAIRARYERQLGPIASAKQLRTLVDEYVEDEILYREALTRGFASDNPAVVNRLHQKLAFLGDEHVGELSDTEAVRKAAELGLAEQDVILRNMFVRNMLVFLEREADRDPEPGEIEAYFAVHQE